MWYKDTKTGVCLFLGITISVVISVSNKHKFQGAFWAHGLNFLRALTNVCRSKRNNLNLKAYKINARIFLITSASMCFLNF